VTKTYSGSCHCGDIKFEIDTIFSEFTICDCSLCKKKNAVMTKVHEDQFRLLKGEDKLGVYQWNTHTAVHHFCLTCGIYTFHRKRVTPDYFGVNVHCLETDDINEIAIIQTDGQSMSLQNSKS